jgi:hypothetical protein
MNPRELAQLCANSLNGANKLGLPMQEAHVLVTTLRIPTKSAEDSGPSRPPVPIEAGQGFR